MLLCSSCWSDVIWCDGQYCYWDDIPATVSSLLLYTNPSSLSLSLCLTSLFPLPSPPHCTMLHCSSYHVWYHINMISTHHIRFISHTTLALFTYWIPFNKTPVQNCSSSSPDKFFFALLPMVDLIQKIKMKSVFDFFSFFTASSMSKRSKKENDLTSVCTVL